MAESYLPPTVLAGNMNDIPQITATMKQLLMDTRVPGLSYPTDLLFNIKNVQSQSFNGLVTQKSMIDMLKGRIAAENQYAAEMKRLADQSNLENLERGTLKDALGALRGQYLNSSRQHAELAENLQQAVLPPLLDSYQKILNTSHKAKKYADKLGKQVKNYEDRYLKSSTKYEREFREASAVFAAAIEAEVSSDSVEEEYTAMLLRESTNSKPTGDSVEQERDIEKRRHSMSSASKLGRLSVPFHPSNNATSTDIIDRKMLMAMKAKRLSSTTKPKKNSGTALVSWLLPSQEQKKYQLAHQTAKSIMGAEKTRRECSDLWKLVEEARLQQHWSFQSILLEYQLMEEERVSVLTSAMKNEKVYEYSCLANQEYDWRKIAEVFEEIDPKKDFREFIQSNKNDEYPKLRPEMTFDELYCINSSPNGSNVPIPSSLLKGSTTTSDRSPSDYLGHRMTPLEMEQHVERVYKRRNPPSENMLQIADLQHRKIPTITRKSAKIHGYLATPADLEECCTESDGVQFMQVVPTLAVLESVRAAHEFRIQRGHLDTIVRNYKKGQEADSDEGSCPPMQAISSESEGRTSSEEDEERDDGTSFENQKRKFLHESTESILVENEI